MKKSTLFITIGALIIIGLFYWNMHRNGSFNDVKIESKENVSHDIYGVWVEGSFKQDGEGDYLSEVQRTFIEDFNQERISVFYEVNPRKENQESFKAFVGSNNAEVLNQADSLIHLNVRIGNIIAGKQICTPGFQKIHGNLINEAEENKYQLSQDSIYEEYTDNEVYVEMKKQ